MSRRPLNALYALVGAEARYQPGAAMTEVEQLADALVDGDSRSQAEREADVFNANEANGDFLAVAVDDHTIEIRPNIVRDVSSGSAGDVIDVRPSGMSRRDRRASAAKARRRK
jgi:hypothetical protein